MFKYAAISLSIAIKLRLYYRINYIYTFDDLLLASSTSNMLVGYFQDKKIFDDCYAQYWEEVYRLLVKSSDSLSISYPCSYKPSDSLYVHVRKGDYVNHKDIYHSLEPDYFLESISSMVNNNSLIKNIVFFTDSPEWVISKIVSNVSTILDVNSFSIYISVADEVSAFLDLCDARYLVISNSTFSLTAAHISRINHPDRLLIQPHYWLANQLNHLSID